MAGYFEHFDATRLQIIGFVEYTYMESLSEERKADIYDELMSYDIPCIVFCRELKPDPIFLETAVKHQVPVLSTKKSTSSFMAEIIRWLNVKLAPCISVHGVLVDVYGEGVLITGESGIGKSEAALELIKRGHRLVTDDVVELRKVSDDTIIGTAPDITKHFIELRGIGIVDVKALFGASSVRDTQQVDLVIRLEDWDKDKEYDRLGLEEKMCIRDSSGTPQLLETNVTARETGSVLAPGITGKKPAVTLLEGMPGQLYNSGKRSFVVRGEGLDILSDKEQWKLDVYKRQL